ncbi:MAG: hypothetical protein PVH17_05470 [Anaerolineae bacterium]
MVEIAGNILVIDDEVGMREGCRRALTPHGYRVSTAEHGAGGGSTFTVRLALAPDDSQSKAQT